MDRSDEKRQGFIRMPGCASQASFKNTSGKWPMNEVVLHTVAPLSFAVLDADKRKAFFLQLLRKDMGFALAHARNMYYLKSKRSSSDVSFCLETCRTRGVRRLRCKLIK